MSVIEGGHVGFEDDMIFLKKAKVAFVGCWGVGLAFCDYFP